MINYLIFTLIILFKITNCDGRVRCDNRNCHYHGVCVQQEKPFELKCECVPGVYTGKNCATLVKQCDKSSCDAPDTCMNYPGSYQCICAESNGGQNCLSKMKRNYTNPIVLYDPLVELDETRIVIVFFESLPLIDMRFEMTAEQKMMSIKFIYSSTHDTKFRETKNLKRLAAEYRMFDYEELPALSGKYITIMYHVVKTFKFNLNLKLYNLDSDIKLYDWNFVVLSSGTLLSFNGALLALSVLCAIIFNKNS